MSISFKLCFPYISCNAGSPIFSQVSPTNSSLSLRTTCQLRSIAFTFPIMSTTSLYHLDVFHSTTSSQLCFLFLLRVSTTLHLRCMFSFRNIISSTLNLHQTSPFFPSDCLSFISSRLDSGRRRIQQTIQAINGKTNRLFLYLESF